MAGATAAEKAAKEAADKAAAEAAEKEAADKAAKAAAKAKKVFYTAQESGRTTGKSGRPIRYDRGQVLELPDGELDHCVGFKKTKQRPKKD